MNHIDRSLLRHVLVLGTGTMIGLTMVGCSTGPTPEAPADAMLAPDTGDADVQRMPPTPSPSAMVAPTSTAAFATQPSALETPPVLLAMPSGAPPTDASDADEDARKTRYQPLAAEACDELALVVETAVGADAEWSEEPFLDYVDPSAGSGCAVQAAGTGEVFGDIEGFPGLLGAADAVRSALGLQGWVEDPNYGAGAPNAVGSGLRSDDRLCLLVVRWQPSDDADCPPGRPFDECELEPEQRLYHVELNCASSLPNEAATP